MNLFSRGLFEHCALIARGGKDFLNFEAAQLEQFVSRYLDAGLVISIFASQVFFWAKYVVRQTYI